MCHDVEQGPGTFEKSGGEHAIGYDLTCCTFDYKDDGRIILGFGIKVEPPEDYYFELVPRSSFSKTGFVMANSIGIIDPDYRGEWMMVIRSVSRLFITNFVEELFINKRVAQAILRKIQPDHNVEFVEELSATDRGENGFGSSGT